MTKDYYAVLNLDRDATDEEIKAIYREIVKECHPDVAGGDAEKIERFKEATEAYKILIDPYRRRLHDRDLPMKSYPLRRPTAPRVWKEVNEVILLRSDRVGPFQRALQSAQPIALEDNKIIVGFKDADYREARYLDVAADRRRLQNALELIVGKPIDYRYIQGTTQQDWERIKAGEERVAARAKKRPPIIETIRQTDAWDSLLERMSRGYNAIERKQQPQNVAAFMIQALLWIKETANQQSSAQTDSAAAARGLAKAIERLANLAEIPPVVVALELEKLGDSDNPQA